MFSTVIIFLAPLSAVTPSGIRTTERGDLLDTFLSRLNALAAVFCGSLARVLARLPSGNGERPMPTGPVRVAKDLTSWSDGETIVTLASGALTPS
jgi:hypothetical protein